MAGPFVEITLPVLFAIAMFLGTGATSIAQPLRRNTETNPNVLVTRRELDRLAAVVNVLANEVRNARQRAESTSRRERAEFAMFLSRLETTLSARLDAKLANITAHIEKMTSTDATGNRPNGQEPSPHTASSSCQRASQPGANTASRIYRHRIGNATFLAVCNMTVDGGGWTVLMRSRGVHSREFARSWNSFKEGFGILSQAFWLGNENIHQITTSSPHELRIDFRTRSGADHFIKYSPVSVGSESDQYRLHVGWETQSSFRVRNGVHLDYHNLMVFSTRDQDNTRYCVGANEYVGWWYRGCDHVLPYGFTSQFTPHSSLSYFTMSVRPVSTLP